MGYRDELEALQSRVQHLERALEESRERLAKSQVEIAGMHAKQSAPIRSGGRDTDAFRSKIAELANAKDALAAERDALQETVVILEASVATLERTIATQTATWEQKALALKQERDAVQKGLAVAPPSQELALVQRSQPGLAFAFTFGLVLGLVLYFVLSHR